MDTFRWVFVEVCHSSSFENMRFAVEVSLLNSTRRLTS